MGGAGRGHLGCFRRGWQTSKETRGCLSSLSINVATNSNITCQLNTSKDETIRLIPVIFEDVLRNIDAIINLKFFISILL